ncbi:unnamed protein product [Discosporangium mesarthrocarpum]
MAVGPERVLPMLFIGLASISVSALISPRPLRGLVQGRLGCSMSTSQLPNLTGRDLAVRYPVDGAFAERLRRCGLDSTNWQNLLAIGELRVYEENELIIREGSLPRNPEEREVYLILRGECQLEVRGRAMARLEPSSFAGEASFASRSKLPRSATVRTITDVEALSWSTRNLSNFMDNPANIEAKSALERCWTQELATKLSDAMFALEGGKAVRDEGKQVLGGDYGYSSRASKTKAAVSATPPKAVTLAAWTFAREYRALRRTFRFDEFISTPIAGLFSSIDKFLEKSVFDKLHPSLASSPPDKSSRELQHRLTGLKLSNKAIMEREDRRIEARVKFLKGEARKGIIEAQEILAMKSPWVVWYPYRFLCYFLDTIFDGRPIQRFWFLETVARMPYFSYLSMLHLYESLGWWTAGSEVRKIHFAEEWNEMQHLKIMESLGGDSRWSDRFLARHAAIVYYWILNAVYLISPFLAYNFSELLESHAVDTYTEFIEVNRDLLKSLPPTTQALDYYTAGDMYLFDEFQTARPAYSRRPIIRNLYDVFRNIRDDEMEHVKTMFACEGGEKFVVSPNVAIISPPWALDAENGDEALPYPSTTTSINENIDMATDVPAGSSQREWLMGWWEDRGHGEWSEDPAPPALDSELYDVTAEKDKYDPPDI